MNDEKLRAYREFANTQQWYHRKHFSLSKDERYWLRGNESLTKQLIAQSKTFEVIVLQEETAIPFVHEAQKLGLETNEKTRIREVELRCENTPSVYARSIIPLVALKGSGLKLANLGNKPLGHLLFKQAKVDLETREIAKIERTESYTKESHWARRTLYRFNQQDILVSEFFLFQF